jgi:RNA recognition motif-containing protein
LEIETGLSAGTRLYRETGDAMRPNNKFRGNVFVANLPLEFSDEQLAALFDPFGLVLGAYLARDPVTHAKKGYGLVNLAPDRVAAEAVKAINGQQIGGRRVEAKLADPNMAITLPKPRRPVHGPGYDAAPLSTPVAAPPRRPVVVEYRRSRIGAGGR